MIDPQDPEAYRTAILNWDEVQTEGHGELLALYRQLIALRAAEPDLADGDLTKVQVDYDEDERWIVLHRGQFDVVANLSDTPRTVPVGQAELVLATGAADVTDNTVTVGPQSAVVVRRAS